MSSEPMPLARTIPVVFQVKWSGVVDQIACTSWLFSYVIHRRPVVSRSMTMTSVPVAGKVMGNPGNRV
jgi:hypothetical protein